MDNLPINHGQKWNLTEENLLLQEFNDNIDINIIAQNHGRTVGGIKARQKIITYDLYMEQVPIEEIIAKIRLSKEEITEIITNKQSNIVYNMKLKNASIEEIIEKTKLNMEQIVKIIENKFSLCENKQNNKTIDSKIIEMKNEINELKSEINELKSVINEMRIYHK